MNKLIILLLISVSSVACTAQKDAQLRADRAQDALIIEHKLSLIDEQIDDEQYEQYEQYEQSEQSEKADNARHANDFIKNNRSDGL